VILAPIVLFEIGYPTDRAKDLKAMLVGARKRTDEGGVCVKPNGQPLADLIKPTPCVAQIGEPVWIALTNPLAVGHE
jgi:hypothetical protein